VPPRTSTFPHYIVSVTHAFGLHYHLQLCIYYPCCAVGPYLQFLPYTSRWFICSTHFIIVFPQYFSIYIYYIQCIPTCLPIYTTDHSFPPSTVTFTDSVLDYHCLLIHYWCCVTVLCCVLFTYSMVPRSPDAAAFYAHAAHCRAQRAFCAHAALPHASVLCDSSTIHSFVWFYALFVTRSRFWDGILSGVVTDWSGVPL